MGGKIRSVFLMTDPRVASSDATNIDTSIVCDPDHYVSNGRKWWSSGIGDPRCSVGILMGKTNPDAPRHAQQSMLQIGRAHFRTPVTNAHLVCRLLLETKKSQQ